MLLTLDLDHTLLIYSPGHQSAVAQAQVPYGSGVELRILPVRKGIREALPPGFGMSWIAKTAPDFSGDALVFANAFVLHEATGHYVASVGYNAPALQEMLNIGGGSEEGSVSMRAQLAWRTAADASWQLTQVITLVVHNSVWRDDSASPSVPVSGSLHYYSEITGLTGGGTTKLDGIATTSLPDRALAMLVVDNVPSTWILDPSTDAEDEASGIVRPDDYDGVTNPRVWRQIA